MGEPYALTAEFYDVVHGHAYTERARSTVAPFAAEARHGILDIGAGTGLVAAVMAEASPPGLPIWAVEPAASMRTVLMARLAAQPVLRERVTVLPAPMQDVDLPTTVDLAVCIDTIIGLDPGGRPAVWAAVARALVPGGLLVLDFPRRVGEERPARRIAQAQVGMDVIEAISSAECESDDRWVWTFRYVVRRAGKIVRDSSERFPSYVVTPAQLREEMAEVGLELVDRCDARGVDLLIARQRG